CHEAIQVLIRDDDNTGAALHSPVRTDRKVLAFLEETQQFHLGSMAQIANFIKKQGAAGSPCDHPFPCIASPGVSAFAVAEKGVGKHHIVEPGRIDPYKITASAAESMDGPGHQLLADTGFPRNQDRLIRDRGSFEITEQRMHPGAAGDNRGKGSRIAHLTGEKRFPEGRYFAAQSIHLKRLAYS